MNNCVILCQLAGCQRLSAGRTLSQFIPPTKWRCLWLNYVADIYYMTQLSKPSALFELLTRSMKGLQPKGWSTWFGNGTRTRFLTHESTDSNRPRQQSSDDWRWQLRLDTRISFGSRSLHECSNWCQVADNAFKFKLTNFNCPRPPPTLTDAVNQPVSALTNSCVPTQNKCFLHK